VLTVKKDQVSFLTPTGIFKKVTCENPGDRRVSKIKEGEGSNPGEENTGLYITLSRRGGRRVRIHCLIKRFKLARGERPLPEITEMTASAKERMEGTGFMEGKWGRQKGA